MLSGIGLKATEATLTIIGLIRVALLGDGGSIATSTFAAKGGWVHPGVSRVEAVNRVTGREVFSLTTPGLLAAEFDSNHFDTSNVEC